MTKQTPASSTKRRTARLYLLLLTLGLMAVLGIAAGKWLMPPLARWHYARQLTNGSENAARWWQNQITIDHRRAADLLPTWRSVRDNDAAFIAVGRVFADSRVLDNQPADLQFRYYALTRLAATQPDQRVLAVAALPGFADAPADQLQAAVETALADPSPDVALAAIAVLPHWLDQDWAASAISRSLHDARPEVRRQAALAAGVFGPLLRGDSFRRMAQLSITDRLAIMALRDSDPQTRVHATWALYRMDWMARSAFDLCIAPIVPLRQTAPLVLTRQPISTDHTDPAEIATMLERMASDDPDPGVRERAAQAISITGGVSAQTRSELARTLLASDSWSAIAIGARLAGRSHSPATLSALLARLARTNDAQPDEVNEQFALALESFVAWAAEDMQADHGEADAETSDPDDRTTPQQIRDRALGGLAVLYSPAVLAIATQPASQVDLPPSSASPRTRLAAASALARLGALGPLIELAGERLEPSAARDVSPETLADLACLEFAQIAGRDDASRQRVLQIARTFARDYSERVQCSGYLLLGLLGEPRDRDDLARRLPARRAVGMQAKMPVLYIQAALLLLTGNDPLADAPLTGWLVEPACQSPGLLLAMLQTGRREAMDQLFGAASSQPLLDGWRFRDYLLGQSASGTPAIVNDMIRPLPACDAEMTRFIARMSNWLYQTQKSRFAFDPRTRAWRIGTDR